MSNQSDPKQRAVLLQLAAYPVILSIAGILVVSEYVAPTSSHWLPFVGMAIILYFIISLGRLERGPRFLLLLAFAYYLYWLYFFPNRRYTNDLQGHLDYLEAITGDWRNILFYQGRESWHPPTYYFLHGGILVHLKPASVSGIGFYRFLSLPLFLVYLYYGFRTVQFSLKPRSLCYYTSLGLIAFWPLSVQMASRVNNDIAFYAVSSVAFFYIVQWWKCYPPRVPLAPLLFISIAATVKTNAIVLLALVFGLVLTRYLKGEVRLSALFRPKGLLAMALLVIGLVINSSKAILALLGQLPEAAVKNHLGGAGAEQITIWHFIRFDPIGFVANPFIDLKSGYSFFDFFLRSMLYGEFSWRNPAIASVLNGIFLLLIGVLIFETGWNIFSRPRIFIKQYLPHIAFIALLLLSVMAFMFLKKMEATQDFRFAFPLCIPFAILYGHIMKTAAQRKRYLKYSYGILALSFMLTGVTFYLSQFAW